MNREKFNAGIHDIYAIFGKAWPKDAVLDAIYAQIANFPDSFMEFAVKRMQDEEKLAANLGRFLRLDVWPDFLSANQHLLALQEQKGCPRCDQGLPGYRTYWEKDGTPHTCRCTCNTDSRTAHLWTPTDLELEQGGFLASNPFPFYSKPKMPQKMRDAIGNNDKPRERHQEYLSSLDAGI